MAILTSYQLADMLNPYIWYGDVDSATSTQIVITDYAGNTGIYYGSFSYTPFGLAGGTVTAYDNYSGYSLDYTVRNGSLNALVVKNYLDNGDAIGLQQYALNGNDTIIGSASADILLGWNGNDYINGGAGDDFMAGGIGNDTYGIDNAGDSIFEYADEGIDQVNIAITVAGGTYTLADNVENARLINTVAYNIIANDLDNALTGNAGANSIVGGAGNDTLIGGEGNDSLRSGTGSDVLSGGNGDDAYFIDVSTDIILADNSGIDTVNVFYATGTYTLAADLEHINLFGTVAINGTGNARDNSITGNAGANSIAGDAGNDLLLGGNGDDTLNGGAGNDTLGGGAGNDVLNGGEGADLYLVGNAAFKVQAEISDTGLSGIDELRFASVLAGTTLTVNAGDTGLERVVIGTGLAAVADITGTVALNVNASAALNALSITGNAGANSIAGGAGNDTLDGGTGNDTLNGGLGNDTYIINIEFPDKIALETDLGGIDTVNLIGIVESLDYLPAIDLKPATGPVWLENLNMSSTGATKLNVIGNILNNTITGNTAGNFILGGAGNDLIFGGAGNDRLDGGEGNDTLRSGAGSDTLSGGNGNDAYFIEVRTDVILADSSGIDTVNVSYATGTYALAANLEHLNLLGTAAINGTGNAFDNSITGNTAANLLLGGNGDDTLNGGAGNDILNGGLGQDIYVFNTALNGLTNKDIIQGFNVVVDQIKLDAAIFGAIGVTLDINEFTSGAGITSASTADQHIIFNSTTGALYYDADGFGGQAATEFAKLIGSVGTLTANDFFI